MKPIVSLLATALLLGWTAFADTIAEWNFNNTAAQTTPSAGAGTLGPIGGITVSAAASGVGSSDPETAGGADNAYQTTGYPAAAVGDRTAGIEVAASTVGYKNVTVRFDYRGSNTSSRKLAVLYSLDGATFIEGAVAEILTGGAFTNGITLDLTAVPGANENPNFKVRIVSTFADGAAYTAISGNYGTAGTARFDMVTVAGEPSSSEPRPPVIFTQPVDRTAFVGSTATFSVVAGGSAPLAYFWEKDKQDGFGTWELVEGGTGATLSLPNVQFAQAGTYRVTVSNALNVVRSVSAQLTVQEDPANVVSTIAQLRAKVDPATLVPTNTTTVYKAEGIVTTHINITTAGNHFFYIQDATGGIGVFVSGATGEVPPAGAKVRVTGPLAHFNGLLELGLAGANTAHKVEVLSTGNPLPTPTPLNYAWPTGVSAADDVNVIDAEANEAKLVIASNVVIDPSSGPTFTSGSNVIITDAADPTKTFTLRIDSRVIDIIGQQKPTGPATIVGVLGQFDGSDPRAGGYQLLPTRFADIESAFKAATIRFTNTLSNLVRPGDQLTNTFAEHALRPGESIYIGFEITDPENRPVTVTLGNAIPAGAEWSFGSLSGTKVNGAFRYTATAAAAGQAFDVAVTADNGATSFTQTIRLYVPTVAEQQVVITEFYANPASTNAVAWFNPLNRAELLPGGNDASPANRDEFVELVNLSGESIDLTGWMISDALLRRAYVYPGTAGTTLAPSNSLIVYGGPAFGFTPQLSVPAIAAEVGPGDAFSTAGLALNDGGDTIVVRNAQSNIISRVLYAQSQTSTNGSLVRFPTDRDGFVAHSGTGARYWSPGTQADGKAWTEAQPNADVAPAIVTPPVNLSVAAGIPATFSVLATGVPAPTYRWQRDGVGELPGETAASYTLASPQLTDDGASFRVIIANRAGSITSAPVTLTVTAPPPEIIRTNIAYLRTQVDAVNLRPANTTQLYEVQGTVTTHVNLTGAANCFFYLQDDTAGISAFVTGKPGTEVPPAGARVRIVGPLGHFNGLLELNLVATNAKHVVEVLSTGNPLPAPVALDYSWPISSTGITAASTGVAGAEANEARLVRVDNVLVDTATGANFTSGSNVTITDAADPAKTFVLRIDSRVTEVIGQPKPTAAVSLVGVLGQFDSADPRAGGYQLIVTRLADIISGVVPGPITAAAAVTGETVTLTWNGTLGATYSVLASTNAAGPFSAVVTGLTSPTHSASTAGETGGFFRITSP
jgi:hypothetical protein